MLNYDLVIFDVDGTLLDTTEGILSSAKHTIKAMGYEMLSDELLASFIGPPIQDSFAKAYGLDGDVLQVIAGIFRNQYKDHDLLKAAPYPGIFDMFQTLDKAGIKMAIATYKREDYAITLLKHFGIDQYVESIYGGDHENKLKKKDIIEKCIRDSGITDRKRIVMIGDTLHDSLGSEYAGVDFIGVTFGFGFHSKEEIEALNVAGAVDTAEELAALLTEGKV